MTVVGAVPRVHIQELSKQFELRKSTITALKNVSLDIGDGEFVCIVGPSGCGKTTLLRILAELETPSAGEIRIMHNDPTMPVHSMIFQEQSVFPWMTVRDNIAYGLRMRGVRGKARDETVQYYLEKVGLSQFAKAYPHQLSGGMKQRVSIARAFANNPSILLMDEPFAALDEQNKTLLQDELLRVWEETRKTVVFITHSIDEAILLGDRVVVMTASPGEVKAIVTVTFERPRKVYELRTHPEFSKLAYQLWDLLRDEVMKAKRMEGRE